MALHKFTPSQLAWRKKSYEERVAADPSQKAQKFGEAPAPKAESTGSPVLDKMVKEKLPLTQEQYLALDRWEPNPKLSAEEEAGIPPQIR